MTHSEWIATTLDRIGKEVQRARKSAGLTQDELANDVGITRNALQNLESPAKRRSTIDLLTLILIARRVGISPAQLVYPALPDGPVEIWPDAECSSIDALLWFSGRSTAPRRLQFQGSGTVPYTNIKLVTLSEEYARKAHMVYTYRIMSRTSDDEALKKEAAQVIPEMEREVDELLHQIRELGGTIDA